MTEMTHAQAAQQNNRDGAGKYATKEHSEATVADLGDRLIEMPVNEHGELDVAASVQARRSDCPAC